MITEKDERKGLVKTDWATIRKRVAKVEPTFAKIVDDLSPDKSFPVYLAYYPYGAFMGDTETTFIPKIGGNYYRLSDPNAPKDVIKHIGYGKNSAPLAIVLEKELEFFIDLPVENITIPWAIYSPGAIFPFTRTLSKKSSRVYAPNGVLSTTSGVRSTFMLPNIGCITNHINMQRDFNIQNPPPKSLYEHWYIFREIINSNVINCDWRSCVLYFAEKWIDKLHNDKAWLPLKTYLLNLAWYKFEYERNRVHYDITFSVIQKKRNLKPNPYLADTARHLFATALGSAPGYAPARDSNALPLDILQKAFTESYGLKKYISTIMQPTHFNFEEDELPVYYSLQNPSTYVFSPKSRKVSSTLFELRELEHIMRIFVNELSKANAMCSDTILEKIAKDVQFDYFHNEPDRHRVIKPSTEIERFDTRFSPISENNKTKNLRFASDAPFVRGCVSIRKK